MASGTIKRFDNWLYLGQTTGTNKLTFPTNWKEGMALVAIGNSSQSFDFHFLSLSRDMVLNRGNPSASASAIKTCCAIQINWRTREINVYNLNWYGQDRLSEALLIVYYKI